MVIVWWNGGLHLRPECVLDRDALFALEHALTKFAHLHISPESTPRASSAPPPGVAAFEQRCLAAAGRILALLEEAGLAADRLYVMDAVSFLADARRRERDRDLDDPGDPAPAAPGAVSPSRSA
jgi:hypothetical protein